MAFRSVRGSFPVAATLLAAAVAVLLFPPGVARAASPIDKWSLWSGGTKLRGANVYQRRVYLDVDGPDYMGPGPFGPPYVQEDFDRLAALGANYVDLSHPGIWTEKPPFRIDEAAQANLDRMLAMAKKAGLWAVISFRTGPGRSEFGFFADGAGVWFPASYLNDTVWSDAAAQSAWCDMWHATAARYASHPEVAGYDLMVEPNSNSLLYDLWSPDQFYPRYAGSLADWNQLHPRVSAAIRSVDPATPILTSSMSWGSPDWLNYLTRTGDARTVYTFHQYDPHQFTHQDPPCTVSYPCASCAVGGPAPETFDRAWLEARLAPIAAWARTNGVTLAVNEFGVKRWVPGGDAYLGDAIQIFEREGWNHAIWVWSDSWPPMVANDNFNFRHGPDPANHADLPSSPIGGVLSASWARNAIRPTDAPAAVWLLPSSARIVGSGGAFYTTTLTVANTGTADAVVTAKFLGHDVDGRSGPEATWAVGAGRTRVVEDVLGKAFGLESGYGAIRVGSSVTTLAVSGETSTPAPSCVGGTFGQSVPAVAAAGLVAAGSSRSIAGVREDSSFRTNLVLANAAETAADVGVTLVLADGTVAKAATYRLEPLGMRQVTRVVRDLGWTADVTGGRLVVAPGAGSVAAYAAVIDDATNDPRTLLPQ